MAADKRPSFQFYPGDWMKDPALRACSLAARGLWMDCLCLMFESPRRGYLEHATGQPVTAEQVARMVGATVKEAATLLAELEQVGVSSKTEAGVIYSRRLVRDEEIRVARALGGERGAEHGAKGGRPTKRGSRRNPSRTPPQTPSEPPSGQDGEPQTKPQDGGQNNPPSSSSSSSPSGGSPPDPPPRERARNPLFDALAEVSGLDPRTAGGRIGKAAAELATAGYSPEEVREFARRFWEFCPYASRDNRARPTPQEIVTNIGLVRAGPPPQQRAAAPSSRRDRGAEYLRMGLDAAGASDGE